MYIIILLLFYRSYVIIILLFIWGIGAVGSAPHWQCGGQEFEPPMLHQTKKPACAGFFYGSMSNVGENY